MQYAAVQHGARTAAALQRAALPRAVHCSSSEEQTWLRARVNRASAAKSESVGFKKLFKHLPSVSNIFFNVW